VEEEEEEEEEERSRAERARKTYLEGSYVHYYTTNTLIDIP